MQAKGHAKMEDWFELDGLDETSSKKMRITSSTKIILVGGYVLEACKIWGFRHVEVSPEKAGWMGYRGRWCVNPGLEYSQLYEFFDESNLYRLTVC